MTIHVGQDRIGQLDAEIATLYGEANRLDRECETVSQDEDNARYHVVDNLRQNLREHARTLDKGLTDLLAVQVRTDRIAILDAELKGLYREVERLGRMQTSQSGQRSRAVLYAGASKSGLTRARPRP